MINRLFKYYTVNPFFLSISTKIIILMFRFFLKIISFNNYQFFKIKCAKNMSLTKFKCFFLFSKNKPLTFFLNDHVTLYDDLYIYFFLNL